jgi:hypothetical protein
MGLRPLDERSGTGIAPPPPAPPSTGLSPIPSNPPRRRGVLGGLVVFAVGLAFMVPAIGIGSNLSGPLLFIAIGGAFGFSYWYGNRQYAYLVPAATLLGLGVGLLIPAVFDLGAAAGAAFFAALALALVSVTLLAPDRRWPLIPAAPLALIAVAGFLGRVDLVPVAIQPFILPVVLMLVGAYVLFEPSHR